MIDCNVHILPGVDDGATDEEQAIYMLEKAKADGITHWIVTPHFNYKNMQYTYETLRNKYDDWFQTYGDFASGNLIFGLEVFVDALFLENLGNLKRLPTFENSHYMLIEFDLTWPFYRIKDAIIQLKAHGIFPIIAHTETYEKLAENANNVKWLSEEGALIQITASSFMSKIHQKFIRELLMLNAIDLVASDGYDSTSRPPILSEAYDYVARYYSKAWANRLFIETPMKVFYGEHYFQPLNSVKLRKSYRISMSISVVFGLMLMAIGISQMINAPPTLVTDSQIVIAEESIPLGFSNVFTYEEIIKKNSEERLEIYNEFESALNDIHELILKAQIEIPNFNARISQIDTYLREAATLEKQYDLAVFELLTQLEEDLRLSGYSTAEVERFKKDYTLFKESIMTKYLVIF